MVLLGRQQACVDVSICIQRHTGGQREAVGVVLAVAGSASPVAKGRSEVRTLRLRTRRQTANSMRARHGSTSDLRCICARLAATRSAAVGPRCEWIRGDPDLAGRAYVRVRVRVAVAVAVMTAVVVVILMAFGCPLSALLARCPICGLANQRPIRPRNSLH